MSSSFPNEGFKNGPSFFFFYLILILKKIEKFQKSNEQKNEQRMWPLYECVFYVQIQAAEAGLFWQVIG